MNERIKNIYTLTVDNRVVVIDTNLADFVASVRAKEPSFKNYQWFYRAFNKAGYFPIQIMDTTYHFQRFVNNVD